MDDWYIYQPCLCVLASCVFLLFPIYTIMETTVQVPLQWAKQMKSLLEDYAMLLGDNGGTYVENHANVMGICIESATFGKLLFHSLEGFPATKYESPRENASILKSAGWGGMA